MVRIDMHVHTNYSDGVDSAEEIIRQAERMGLDGIAIADHDTFGGLYEALEIETDLLIIPGIEVSTCKGHILAYGILEGEIEVGLTPKETVDIIHKMGGIAVPAHPFDTIRLGIKKEVYHLNIDALEVINGCITFSKCNQKAFKVARELDLPMIAGSDGHSTEEIGNAWTDFLEQPESWQDVISMILRKESIPIGGRHPVIPSKIRRFIKTFRKRKERPVPYPWIKQPKQKSNCTTNSTSDNQEKIT
ncbi:MAG: CehA/McbA family metallohydrolase [Candidatus Heimdallarchaeota archaeon]|nr:CehA/McbA family metallohydrolase [Candidatus Heimdallarchaeota archaeon]